MPALHRDHLAAGTQGSFGTTLEVSIWSSNKREQFVLEDFKYKFLLSPLPKWWDIACKYCNINCLNGPAEVLSHLTMCQPDCRGKQAKQQFPKSRVKKLYFLLCQRLTQCNFTLSACEMCQRPLEPAFIPALSILLHFYLAKHGGQW